MKNISSYYQLVFAFGYSFFSLILFKYFIEYELFDWVLSIFECYPE